MAGNFERLKAARLFAAEIRNTAIQVPKKGSDQYESQLYLTPTGAKTARIMFVGTATEVEDIGTDSSFFRMRVSDPTGVAFVTAGQYQPEAARMIQELMSKVPAFVAVIGKLSLYTNEGTTLVSIRAEQIAIVDENVRNTWLLETAKATFDRIAALKASADLEQEVAAAYPTKEDYKELVKKVLLDMKNAPTGAVAPPAAQPAQKQPAMEKPPVNDPENPVSEEDMMNFVEQKIISMSKGKGVKLESLGNPCKGAGITLIQLETAIKQLMHEGRIYEPKLGTLMAS